MHNEEEGKAAGKRREIRGNKKNKGEMEIRVIREKNKWHKYHLLQLMVLKTKPLWIFIIMNPNPLMHE